MQWHTALAVPLGPGHLGSTQTTRALDPDAEGASLLGVLDRTLHGPPEGDPASQLVGHALGDQRRVELRLLDLLDVELDGVVAGDLAQTGPETIGLGALTTNDDSRSGRMHVYTDLVAGALHLHAADGSVGEFSHEVLADLPVLEQVVGVLLPCGEPP